MKKFGFEFRKKGWGLGLRFGVWVLTFWASTFSCFSFFGLEVLGFRFAGFLELLLGVGLKPFPERNMTKTVRTL